VRACSPATNGLPWRGAGGGRPPAGRHRPKRALDLGLRLASAGRPAGDLPCRHRAGAAAMVARTECRKSRCRQGLGMTKTAGRRAARGFFPSTKKGPQKRGLGRGPRPTGRRASRAPAAHRPRVGAGMMRGKRSARGGNDTVTETTRSRPSQRGRLRLDRQTDSEAARRRELMLPQEVVHLPRDRVLVPRRRRDAQPAWPLMRCRGECGTFRSLRSAADCRASPG
jgi:hypothetical protein